MIDTPLNLDAYLRRIGFDRPVAPTCDALARLIERHASAIPFENIDVLAGRVPGLDLASLQDKLVQRPRGGYCFEQNNLLLICLQQIGFTVHRLEARVRAGVPADVATGRTHMALRVTLEGQDYLADVGFGGMAPLAPLQLNRRDEQVAASGIYRFVDVQDGLLLQSRMHDGWSDCYRIAPGEPQHVDFEIGNWFVATHPKATLRQNLVVARAADGGRLTLVNDRLSLRKPQTGAPDERTVNSRAELADVLADGFGIEIDDHDLDLVMAVLDRNADAQLSTPRA